MHSLDPVDPDVDLHIPMIRSELVRHHLSVLASIAAGGAVGAIARQVVGEDMAGGARCIPVGAPSRST